MTITRRTALATTISPLLRAAGPKPNIVLILIDDLGWKDVGFNGGEIPTPRIDSIAAEGTRFTQFSCYPLCTPSRAGLLTGRSPMRQGLMYSVIRPWSSYGVPTEERLLSQVFRDNGYQTAVIGKWHLGHGHRALTPNRRGFDHFYGHMNAEIDYFEHTKLGGLDWQRNGKGVREPGYATELLGNEAVRWIEGRDASRPFFLYLPFNAIHSPMQAPERALERVARITDPKRRMMAAMLHVLDEQVGRVLDTLDRQGLARDTLVMVLGDNGGAVGLGSRNEPYRAGKLTPYEGGLRVPAALRWPGVIRAGGTYSSWMTVLDVFPTLAAAAGVPAGPVKPLDGIDLWPAIRGGRPPEHPEFFVACKRNETLDFQYALRSGPWKIVQTVNTQSETRTELFHLDQDPAETTNRAASDPAIAARLAEGIERWKKVHPRVDYHSSMTPHPGWVPPEDYATLAADYLPKH
jgi:arylsulfatase A-like enzyme